MKCISDKPVNFSFVSMSVILHFRQKRSSCFKQSEIQYIVRDCPVEFFILLYNYQLCCKNFLPIEKWPRNHVRSRVFCISMLIIELSSVVAKISKRTPF